MTRNIIFASSPKVYNIGHQYFLFFGKLQVILL